MRVEGHEVSPRDVLSASIYLYSEKGLVVLFGGAVQLQVYLLERGVGHLALPETVIQTPGVFRLHEDEQLVAVPFGGEETAQGVRVFVDEGPGLLQLPLFQVVDVERDDGVFAVRRARVHRVGLAVDHQLGRGLRRGGVGIVIGGRRNRVLRLGGYALPDVHQMAEKKDLPWKFWIIWMAMKLVSNQ